MIRTPVHHCLDVYQLYKLPGIGDEYYDYCIALEDTSIETLTDSISQILSMDDNKRNKFGQRARKFILTKKNPEVHVAKPLKLLTK